MKYPEPLNDGFTTGAPIESVLRTQFSLHQRARGFGGRQTFMKDLVDSVRDRHLNTLARSDRMDCAGRIIALHDLADHSQRVIG